MATKVFYSNGKLLLTGEYLVLDGAKAIAVPTNRGQYLTVKPIDTPKLIWRSYDEDSSVWFEDNFELKDLKVKAVKQESEVLIGILFAAQQLNPNFLKESIGYQVNTRLTFNKDFGLGSSSTLIANIAKWAEVNPYELLFKSFPGSGYDIACANHLNGALVYQILKGIPKVTPVMFNPGFKEQLYFVYLNKKQSSREGIAHYKSVPEQVKIEAINKINILTNTMFTCSSVVKFKQLLIEHEEVVAEVLQMKTVKQLLFADYSGAVKSLGAWGGDFVLVTVENKSDLTYFTNKGYTNIFSFDEMLLN